MAFEHHFLQLLELPTSSAASSLFLSSPKLKEILLNGKIHGVVRPDLPSRLPLLSALFPSVVQAGRKALHFNRRHVLPSPPPALSFTSESSVGTVEAVVQQAGCWQVKTLAAQLRSERDIRNRLISSARGLDSGGSGGSLLLVSGGHPLRGFPLVERFLPGDSFGLLKMASKLRQNGEIPAGVQFWAVENPLANSVERLERKILAGAEAVIVQPPLLPDVFEQWWSIAHNRGLMRHARVVVGLPLITSADNLAFWFSLTQTSGYRVNSRLAELRKLEASWSTDLHARREFYKEETRELMQFVKNLPGVAGIHFMPVTPSGWRQLSELQEWDS